MKTFLLPVVLLALTSVAAADEFATLVKPYLEANCISCHGPDKQKGRLRLDTLGSDFLEGRNAEIWIEVRDNINLGEMPPEDEPRPNTTQTVAVAKWIATGLKNMRAHANSTGGEVQLRRLSRTEYVNTVRDLLKVDFAKGEGPREILPPDGSLEGFDKVGKALLIDPSLMDNYFAAARFVADRAVVVRPPRVRTWKDRYEFEELKNTQGIQYNSYLRAIVNREDGVELYSDAARTAGFPKHPYSGSSIPVLGTYTVRVRAGATGGAENEPVYMRIVRDKLSKTILVEAPIDRPKVYEWTETFDPVAGEFQVYKLGGRLGEHTRDSGDMRTAFEKLMKDGEEKEAMRLWQQGAAEGFYTVYLQNKPTEAARNLKDQPKLFIDYLEVEGPLQEAFPPASTRFLYPDGHDHPEAQSIETARSIFKRVLPRAFRRPATREEIEQHVALVAAEMERGADGHQALELGLTAMLCSPNFLYLVEPGENRQLNEFELASRLSYFLWSSKPDDELLRLAITGQLRASFDAQVARMLADPKAEALVSDFAQQWLHVAEFDQFKPDEGIYRDTYYKPEFSGIAGDMEEEARAFFRELLRTNASVVNFIDSDWTMANERLATYYGFEGVEGPAFRRVNVPEGSPRGGLLGMAGVHKWGADGARTKPVERGKYLLSVLFNDPPDPPPPNAGEVEPNIRGERLTVRERLLRHQEIEACAGCHRGIDPYGLAMENFNVIGLWRDVQDGESHRFWEWQPPPIIASGTLPNGTKFADFRAFKAELLKQDDRLRRGLAEKMFIYALGRSLEASDDDTLNRLVAGMKAGDDSLRSLIRGIVRTESFQRK